MGQATGQRPTTFTARVQLFQEASAIVEREYAGDLTLEALTPRLFTSPRQLQRAYTQIGGLTFSEQLTRTRLQQAARLLETSPLRVVDVARQVGYRQPAQFARSFRRRYGTNPSVYRDQRRIARFRRAREDAASSYAATA
jgi:transcriptional regulator GlxA family with amidase domain